MASLPERSGSSLGNERDYAQAAGHGSIIPLQRAGLANQPQLRVMSPNMFPAVRELRDHLQAACNVCNRQLAGPLVVCSCCGNAVHSHCALAAMHQTVCERCVAELQSAEQSRQQQQAAARALGLAGARGAELLGTAAGAVGAAGLAAGQFLVHGAQAGARSAWGGAASRAPALELTLPRPASLPPPLPANPSSSSSRSFVPEGVETGRGRDQGPPQDSRLQDFEDRIVKLSDLVESQTAAVAEAAKREQRLQQQLEGAVANAAALAQQHANELRERDARIEALLVRVGAPSEVPAREYEEPTDSGRTAVPPVPTFTAEQSVVAARAALSRSVAEAALVKTPEDDDLAPGFVANTAGPAARTPTPSQTPTSTSPAAAGGDAERAQTRAAAAASAGVLMDVAVAAVPPSRRLAASDEPEAAQAPRSLQLTDERVAAVRGGRGLR